MSDTIGAARPEGPFFIVAMRYSILRSSRWKKAKGEKNYRAVLFDPHRLQVHRRLFRDLALPSLAAQAEAGWGERMALHIVSSVGLPDFDKAFLEAALAPYPWASVRYITPEEKPPFVEMRDEFLSERVESSSCYAHIWLDDDDALSVDFFNRLARYTKRPFVGLGVSFGLGAGLCYDGRNETFPGLYELYRPKLALGLARIGLASRDGRSRPANVHVGGHTKVDQRVPTILDSRAPAFIRTIYAEQDTSGAAIEQVGEPLPPDNIRGVFSVAGIDLPSVEQSRRYIRQIKATPP